MSEWMIGIAIAAAAWVAWDLDRAARKRHDELMVQLKDLRDLTYKAAHLRHGQRFIHYRVYDQYPD
jgi:hypothetical protein